MDEESFILLIFYTNPFLIAFFINNMQRSKTMYSTPAEKELLSYTFSQWERAQNLIYVWTYQAESDFISYCIVTVVYLM